LSAQILQYALTGAKDQAALQFPMQYGKTVSIPLPTDYELIHLTGKTITGESIDMYYPEGSDLLQAITVPVGATSIVYRVSRPDVD
jgi:hypothetical protein